MNAKNLEAHIISYFAKTPTTMGKQINNVKREMESIKNDVLEIKELMRQLLNKG